MAIYDPTATYLNRSFRNIPHQVRLSGIEKRVQAVCKGRKINSYLDLGCASGFITNRISEKLDVLEVVGTDASDEYIQQARANYPKICFTKMDLNRKPAADRVFDLVTCFETMEHVGSLENAIQNMILHIKTGGVGVISVPIETGPVGIVKFLLKSKLYGDKLTEINPVNNQQYLIALIKGRDISDFRYPDRPIWWDHFGFNFKKIETLLIGRNISVVSQSYFTTRFFSIFKN